MIALFYRKILLILLSGWLLSISDCLLSQNLYIEVLDSKTFRPLENVRIDMVSRTTSISLFTSPFGEVAEAVPSGRYDVTFSRRGYSQHQREISVNPYELSTYSIMLDPDGSLPTPARTVSPVTTSPPTQISQPQAGQPAGTRATSPAERATVVDRSDPFRVYRRASATFLYINRGEPLSERLINQMISRGVSGKFNDNSISNQVIDAESGMDAHMLKEYIEKHVSKEILKIWFPFDRSTNSLSFDIIADRGLYDATFSDYIRAGASQRGLTLLKDGGMDLIGRSYVIVYDFFNIKHINDRKTEGYSASCNVYLFQLGWNDDLEMSILNNWSNPNIIDQINAPVSIIKSFEKELNLRSVSVTQEKKVKRRHRRSDDQIFSDFANQIMANADVYLTKENNDFQVKTGIAATSPVRAKIGTKEGVTVNQRYFAYEINQRYDGSLNEKRKGVVRATRHIADNSRYSDVDAGTTRFYQTAGGFLQEGMLLKQKPDWGIGLSATYGNDVNILFEVLANRVPGLRKARRERVKFYNRFIMVIENGNTTLYYYSVGLSREIYFAKLFSITPYAGYSYLFNADSYYGGEVGMNASINLLHNVQLMGHFGINSWKLLFAANNNPFTFGGGLRFQF